MKLKLLFTICLIGIYSVSVFSQTNGEKSTKQIQQTAKINNISWEYTTYDFKTLKQNKPAKTEFIFKNTGREPLSITKVKSSCGCTVTGYDKIPVLPGKESKITATYNSRKAGPFRKTISVFMSDNSQYKLTIKGSVEINEQLTKK
ncbi:MAG: DUF1573 domain-containing protein [Bacteroidales bacterium]|nr:DUF1573 domain-containing protein [Bacteroidales bacterium]